MFPLYYSVWPQKGWEAALLHKPPVCSQGCSAPPLGGWGTVRRTLGILNSRVASLESGSKDDLCYSSRMLRAGPIKKKKKTTVFPGPRLSSLQRASFAHLSEGSSLASPVSYHLHWIAIMANPIFTHYRYSQGDQPARSSNSSSNLTDEGWGHRKAPLIFQIKVI